MKIYEDEIKKAFDELLDSELAFSFYNSSFRGSEILKTDKPAYREGFNNYLDFNYRRRDDYIGEGVDQRGMYLEFED